MLYQEQEVFTQWSDLNRPCDITRLRPCTSIGRLEASLVHGRVSKLDLSISFSDCIFPARKRLALFLQTRLIFFCYYDQYHNQCVNKRRSSVYHCVIFIHVFSCKNFSFIVFMWKFMILNGQKNLCLQNFSPKNIDCLSNFQLPYIICHPVNLTCVVNILLNILIIAENSSRLGIALTNQSYFRVFTQEEVKF